MSANAFPLTSPIEVEGTVPIPGTIYLSNGSAHVEVAAPSSLTGNVNFILPDSDGTANQVLKWPSSGTTLSWEDETITGNTNIWYIKDIKSSGTDGGSFTSGAWQTRTLNTLTKPTGTGTEVQLAVAPAGTNQILIEDGSYRIESMAPALSVQDHQSRLRNITIGVTTLVGTSSTSFSNSASSTSDIRGLFTVSSGPVIFEIQHRCSSSNTSDGFGAASGFGENEVYTQLYIEKIG